MLILLKAENRYKIQLLVNKIFTKATSIKNKGCYSS